MKKSRVSWPSDKLLCQVMMFRKEECPAKIASNLPSGFAETKCGDKLSISHIPRIKWKRPPKFILNEDFLVGSGGKSTETFTENLRIASVLEAFYPHRSVIPNRPCVSPAVEAESYDDSKTPNIRLTPIDDEEPEEPSHSAADLGPDVSLAVSAALSALMKTNEQGSLIDADLLIKLLTDPNVVNLLMNDMACNKPLEAANNNLNTSITKPTLAPQQVTSLAMDRIPPPLVPVSSATSPLLPKLTQPASTATSISLQKPGYYSTLPSKSSPVDAVSVSQQKTPVSQSLNVPTFDTWNTNKVPESDPQIHNGAYLKNINLRDDQVSAKPVKSLEYYKNLIREHGGVAQATNETNNYKERADNVRVLKAKFQKPCMYFGRAKGCKLGENCLYLHDSSKRSWHDVADKFPKAKRLKFNPK